MFQRAGEPDIDAAIPYGGYIWHCKLECKTNTGKATSLQKYRLDRWKEMGYVTGIVRSVEDVKELLDEAMAASKGYARLRIGEAE